MMNKLNDDTTYDGVGAISPMTEGDTTLSTAVGQK